MKKGWGWFSLVVVSSIFDFTCFTLVVSWQQGHPAHKNLCTYPQGFSYRTGKGRRPRNWLTQVGSSGGHVQPLGFIILYRCLSQRVNFMLLETERDNNRSTATAATGTILGFLSWFSFQKLPSVLWHCWLGNRKSTRPVKKLSDELLACLSIWNEVRMICLWSSWCHCHPVIFLLH